MQLIPAHPPDHSRANERVAYARSKPHGKPGRKPTLGDYQEPEITERYDADNYAQPSLFDIRVPDTAANKLAELSHN